MRMPLLHRYDVQGIVMGNLMLAREALGKNTKFVEFVLDSHDPFLRCTDLTRCPLPISPPNRERFMIEIQSTAKLRERWAHWPVLKAKEIVPKSPVSSTKPSICRAGPRAAHRVSPLPTKRNVRPGNPVTIRRIRGQPFNRREAGCDV